MALPLDYTTLTLNAKSNPNTTGNSLFLHQTESLTTFILSIKGAWPSGGFKGGFELAPYWSQNFFQ